MSTALASDRELIVDAANHMVLGPLRRSIKLSYCRLDHPDKVEVLLVRG